MKMVSAAEMRAIDRATTERYGVPSLTLMENAGAAVAALLLERYPEARRVGILCGKGNNGGDGLVAARRLLGLGREVAVLLLADPAELRGDAAEMLRRLPLEPALARREDDLSDEAADLVFSADVLVDAILGTGFQPPVSGLYAAALARLWRAQRPVLAVDVPSGVDADASEPDPEFGLHAPASAVVTFTAPRRAHVFARLSEGPVVVADIGTPAEAITSELGLELITARDIAPLLLPRAPDAHKGDFGHVLVIGGSLGKAGAAAMAGMAALRAGAGLVTVACPRSVLATVAGFAPELMTEPLEETESGGVSLKALEYGRLEALLEGKTVLALGPGLGRHPETAELVRSLVRKYGLPTVLDADGLNAFEGRATDLPARASLVLTPHPGEMARLCGLSADEIQKDRIGVVRRFAAQRGCTVVLKGHRTLIAEPAGTVWVNATGNPGMATGGMGDILTGMVAGFMAQAGRHGPGLGCVLAAVHLHGLAGDLARDELGERPLIATDLLRCMPEALRRVVEAAGERWVRIG